MGNKRRVLKAPPQQKMALVDTKTAVNGCQVLVAHPRPGKARKVAAEFSGHLASLVVRARQRNMGDYYRAHFKMCEKLKNGTDN